MKNKVFRFLLLTFLVLSTSDLVAKQHRYYCEVKATDGLDIIFDFGSKSPYTAVGELNGKQTLVEENGEEIEFNSIVDAANYMTDKGWTFHQAYTFYLGGSPFASWIFYKDAESMEKAREGIMTKTEYKKMNKK